MSSRTEAIARVGGLSNPSKMPTLSWSMPADACILGSKLREIENSACSICYAKGGCYNFPSTVAATTRRLDTLRAALASPLDRAEFREAFATIMASRLKSTLATVKRTGKPGRDDGRYFRWHDAGDVQSVSHFLLICEIADDSPRVDFWLPTREAGMVADYLSAGGTLPPNLIVRLSVPMQNRGMAGTIARLVADHATVTASGIHSGGLAPVGGFETCVAYTQEGACDDCRACWDPAVLVSYPAHY